MQIDLYLSDIIVPETAFALVYQLARACNVNAS